MFYIYTLLNLRLKYPGIAFCSSHIQQQYLIIPNFDPPSFKWNEYTSHTFPHRMTLRLADVGV